MKQDRWNFVVKNYQTDIEADLAKVDCPVLALFGDADENVDTQESISVFDTILKDNDRYEKGFLPMLTTDSLTMIKKVSQILNQIFGINYYTKERMYLSMDI